LEANVPKRPGYTPDFNWCDFYLGDFKLEFIEATQAERLVQRFIDARGEGLHHLSLGVETLDPLLARMSADGIRIVDRFETGMGHATAFVSPRSAHGVLVQFWQVPAITRPGRPRQTQRRLSPGEVVSMQVDHVSLAVRDIETTLAFYRRYFPVTVLRGVHRGYDGRFELCSFRLSGYKIALIQPVAGQRDGFLRRFLERRAGARVTVISVTPSYSLGHGTTDAQKTMGIITVLLFSSGYLGPTFYVPFWVVVICHAAIALGTMFGGWRIVKTMGVQITKLPPIGGFCAETAAAMTLGEPPWLAFRSARHIRSPARSWVLGASRRLSAVRWGVARSVVWAWILTVPCSVLIAAVLVELVRVLRLV
jgi:catechol 2,3-dioxygenase-like lactoylglutathione lyase family enzyme